MISRILKEVLERVHDWPEERQEEAAQLLLEMEQQYVRSYHLTDEQVRKVARIQQEIRESRGVFATDEEMTALWNSLTIN